MNNSVARVTDIPVGKMKGAEFEGKRILIANVGGEFFAMGAVCAHMGGRLDLGSLEGNVVTCPRHGSKWDVKTGRLVKFSRQLPDEPVFKVKVLGGEIFVETDQTLE